MKNPFAPLIILLFTVFSSFAQSRTTLLHNGTSSFFLGATQFTDAYNAAVIGDTILLPAGEVSPPQYINKRLNIFGVGFHPDSSAATGITKVTNNITLQEDADSIFFQGLHVNGSITGAFNHVVDYLRVSRCLTTGLIVPGSSTQSSQHAYISESVILGNVTLNYAQNSDITNCFIQSKINAGNNNAIQNCIILNDGSNDNITGASYCYFANNILNRAYRRVPYGIDYNTFEKNVFVQAISEQAFGTNTETDNWFNVDLTSFFVNQSGTKFNFSHNYHLNSPASYLGTDGTQVGIYGGAHPVKPGWIPIIPHITLKNIDNRTDNAGNLNVEFKVSAQDY